MGNLVNIEEACNEFQNGLVGFLLAFEYLKREENKAAKDYVYSTCVKSGILVKAEVKCLDFDDSKKRLYFELKSPETGEVNTYCANDDYLKVYTMDKRSGFCIPFCEHRPLLGITEIFSAEDNIYYVRKLPQINPDMHKVCTDKAQERLKETVGKRVEIATLMTCGSVVNITYCILNVENIHITELEYGKGTCLKVEGKDLTGKPRQIAYDINGVDIILGIVNTETKERMCINAGIWTTAID